MSGDLEPQGTSGERIEALERRVETLEVLLQDLLLRLPTAADERQEVPRAGPAARATAAPGRYLICRVAARQVGLPLGAVREVVRMAAVRPLPEASPLLEGLLDVRGDPVEVLDARRLLGHPTLEDDLDARIVLVEDGAGGVLGAKVDDVERVEAIGADAIQPPPDGSRAGFLGGVHRGADALALLLDPAGLRRAVHRDAADLAEERATIDAVTDAAEDEAAEDEAADGEGGACPADG